MLVNGSVAGGVTSSFQSQVSKSCVTGNRSGPGRPGLLAPLVPVSSCNLVLSTFQSSFHHMAPLLLWKPLEPSCHISKGSLNISWIWIDRDLDVGLLKSFWIRRFHFSFRIPWSYHCGNCWWETCSKPDWPDLHEVATADFGEYGQLPRGKVALLKGSLSVFSFGMQEAESSQENVFPLVWDEPREKAWEFQDKKSSLPVCKFLFCLTQTL